MIFPFCTIEDVAKKTKNRPVFGEDSKPTADEVLEFMDETAATIRGAMTAAGYDPTNVHATSSTVSGALVAGNSKTVAVADGSGFVAGDKVKIEGTSSGSRTQEFSKISAVSTNDLTITIKHSYDDGAEVYLVNEAMEILRGLNATGAAAMVEDSIPGHGERAEQLWARFNGSEDNKVGLWAIQNFAGFLVGATQTGLAKSNDTMTSYAVENPDDDAVSAGPEFGMKTKW